MNSLLKTYGASERERERVYSDENQSELNQSDACVIETKATL